MRRASVGGSCCRNGEAETQPTAPTRGLHAIQEQSTASQVAELLVKGEISPETFEEWNRETGKAKLPEHVNRPAKRPKRSKTKAKSQPHIRKATGDR
jgi:hypothetical protein